MVIAYNYLSIHDKANTILITVILYIITKLKVHLKK